MIKDACTLSAKEIKSTIHEEWMVFYKYRAKQELDNIKYLTDGKC